MMKLEMRRESPGEGCTAVATVGWAARANLIALFGGTADGDFAIGSFAIGSVAEPAGSARGAEDWLNARRRTGGVPATELLGTQDRDWLTCLDAGFPPRWRGHPMAPALMRLVISEWDPGRPHLGSPQDKVPRLIVEGPPVTATGPRAAPVWITVLPEALVGLGAAPSHAPIRITGAAESNREEVVERLANALRLESGHAGVLLLAGSLRTVTDRESMDGNPDVLTSLARRWRALGGTVYWWIPAVGDGPAARWRRERAILLAADLIVGPSGSNPTGEALSGWRWARRSITDPSVRWWTLAPTGQLAVVRRPGEVLPDDVRTLAATDRDGRSQRDRQTETPKKTEAHWEAG